MPKTIYVLIILSLSLALMGYGMTIEAESMLVNGVAVLELVIPALTFLLTQIFILMFEKERHPWIILGTVVAIITIADMITLGYYTLTLDALNDGVMTLVLLAIIVAAASLVSLTLLSKIKDRTSHHPQLHRQ